MATIPDSSWISLGSKIMSSSVLGIPKSVIFFYFWAASKSLHNLFYKKKIPKMHKNANTAIAPVLNSFLILNVFNSPTIDSTDVYGLFCWLNTTTSTLLTYSLPVFFLFLSGNVTYSLMKNPNFILEAGLTNSSILLTLIWWPVRTCPDFEFSGTSCPKRICQW